MKRKKIRVDLKKYKQEIYLKYPYLACNGNSFIVVNPSHYAGWKEGVDFVIDMYKQEDDNGNK